jgi:dephospho-CoA kinase
MALMQNTRFTIGLTGGIGSGKSAVSQRFAQLGIDIIDADEISRAVVLPGSSALREISTHFGLDILLASGELNRARLRELIFSQPEQKKWLENLLHPMINAAIRTQLNEGDSSYAVLSSPLLLETQQHQLVDRILVVDTSEQLQLERARQRDNNSEAQIKAIMRNQLSRLERCNRANDIIQNHGELGALDEQITRLHQLYLELASAPKTSHQ